MKISLIEHIVCPKCYKKFSLKSERYKQSEVDSGILICNNGHKFLIIRGVPRLVIDETTGFVKTEAAFSSKWKKYNKYYHQKNWFLHQQNWFLDRFGWKNLNNFNKFLKTRNKILDAGTGIGNSAKLFSANSQSHVFAIDASESIDFAYKKYGNQPNIHFLQADLRRLPFRKKFFDFICSDQVLHHTKDTATSFKNLTGYLEKGGLISIYVYNKKAPMREFADDFIREHTTTMSEKECVEFSKDMANLGRILSQLKKKITIPRDIPVLKIKAGTYDIQRFIYWYFLKCFWAEDGNFERSVGVNFDWYFPKFAFRHTPDEIKSWFADAKTKIVHFKEIESGISVTGKKL
ncbi:MAG: class I SAM-dependent methyltransferase [Thaumarchaeota archaeon]|nr:class I SAM-dependent methyltransferase [Nitrososphaerota archaeon]